MKQVVADVRASEDKKTLDATGFAGVSWLADESCWSVCLHWDTTFDQGREVGERDANVGQVEEVMKGALLYKRSAPPMRLTMLKRVHSIASLGIAI